MAARVIGINPQGFDRILQLAWMQSSGAPLVAALGSVERRNEIATNILDLSVERFSHAENAIQQLEAVRIMQLALGDVGPGHALPAVFDGYVSRARGQPITTPVADTVAQMLAAYPTGDRIVDYELARVAAIVQSDSPKVQQAVLDQITNQSDPIDDLHHLIVIARLTAPITATQEALLVTGLLGVEKKFTEKKLPQDRNWSPRFEELYDALVIRDKQLRSALIDHPQFGAASHAVFLRGANDREQQAALRRFADRIRTQADYQWTVELISVLAASTEAAHRDLIRGQLDKPELRDAAISALARNPEARDRALFVEGLKSWQADVVQDCLNALMKSSASQDPSELAALVSVLQKWNRDRAEFVVRNKAARLLQRAVGQTFGFEFDEKGYHPQTEAVQAWSEWLRETYPQLANKAPSAMLDPPALLSRLDSIPWSTGDAERGRALFQKKGCAVCHSGRTALGPDLAGVTKRFSLNDLFTAIADPSRDVSPRYATVIIQTHDGHTFQGAIIYESVDGVTLTNSRNQTQRIESRDISYRGTSSQSLMPTGLLDDLKESDVADLYNYLQSL